MRAFTILFCLFVFTGILVSQTIDHEYFVKNREVYFSFQAADRMMVNQLTNVISIDDVKGNTVFAYANEREFNEFLNFHLNYIVLPHPGDANEIMSSVIEDVKAWDTYPTYDAYVAMMNQFQTQFPTLCKIVEAGTTVQGRKILFAKISKNVDVNEAEPEFMFSSSMHGDEITGYVSMLRLIDYLLNNYANSARVQNLIDHLEIWINPLANPDGTYFGGNSTVNSARRSNANGIDLNRNFPDPAAGPHPDGNAWQPEVLAMTRLFGAHHFTLSANFHGGAEVCNYPWDTWARLYPDDAWWISTSRAFADTVHRYGPSGYMTYLNNGITNGYAWYRITGGRQDYMTYFMNGREETIEISNTKLPAGSTLPTYWESLYRSFLGYMESAFTGIHGLVTGPGGLPVKAKIFIQNHDADSSFIYSDSVCGDYHRLIAPGTWTMIVSAPNFTSQTISNVQVVGTTPTVVNVQLVPSAGAFVTAPNGGENWTAGTTKNITWSSAGIANVKLKYSTNSGANWITIAGNVPAANASYAWNVPNTPSTLCLVRISDALNDNVFDVSNAIFTIAAAPIQFTWQNAVTATDYGGANQNLAFGLSPQATNGIDDLLGEISLPPVPPAGIFDARFELPITPPEYSVKDYRKDSVLSAVWVMKFQPAAGGYPFTFNWNSATLPAGTFYLKDNITGTIVNVDMKAQNNYTLTNSGVTSLKIEYTKQTSYPIQLSAGWNMVSVPVLAANMAPASIFVGANSSVYGYANGYTTPSTLANGAGYWVRYPSASTENINGNPVASTTVPLSAGWNIIGVYHNGVPVSGLTTTPSGIINSAFYGYNNGYTQPTTLESSKGYWVRASQAGVINLPTEAAAKTNSEANRIESNWTKIIFIDAAGNTMTLYGTTTKQNGFDLPPVPPQSSSIGGFDVRFDGDKMADVISSAKEIHINSAVYPVTVRVEGSAITLRDKATAGRLLNQTITSGQSVQITNSGVNTIEVSSNTKPTTFSLAQNYPNPFNPTTVISYQIPVNGLVTLKVYDAIGTEVATLVNEQRDAGSYNVTFDAGKLNSGVYFYTLRTGEYVSTKKLMILK